jgi:hypothetical protein
METRFRAKLYSTTRAVSGCSDMRAEKGSGRNVKADLRRERRGRRGGEEKIRKRHDEVVRERAEELRKADPAEAEEILDAIRKQVKRELRSSIRFFDECIAPAVHSQEREHVLSRLGNAVGLIYQPVMRVRGETIMP